MSKRFKIVLALIVILVVDISYAVTVHGYERYFRLGIVSTYIEDKTCDAIGGKMREVHYNCYSELRCFSPHQEYADYIKGCTL